MEKKSSTSTYKPSSIVNILRNSYFIEELKGTITVKGVYKKSTTQKESVNGYYYDSLQDEDDRNFSMTIRISDKFRDNLIHEKSYIFKGYFNRIISDDTIIKPSVTISYDNFKELGYYYTDDYNKEFNIVKQKKDKGFKSLNFFLENELYNNRNPNILIITGNSSKALGDIYATLGEAKNYFYIQEHCINITSREEIKNSLSQINGNGWDIVLLTRGGGSEMDLDVFNDTEISELALSLDCIFTTAIGHSNDNSLLQKISDRDFYTPTSFGDCLKETVSQVFDRQFIENDLQEQIDSLEREKIQILKNHKEKSAILFNSLEKEQQQTIDNYKKKSIFLLITGIIIGILIHNFLN